MLDGVRPPECDYCWRVEDQGHTSDRVYKSATTWALPYIKDLKIDANNTPHYLELSFSSTCNFKCVYCSPEISSSWMKEIQEHGAYPTSNRYGNLQWLEQTDRMPLDPNGDNPYVDAFWAWFPELYPKLQTIRITGGEPLLSRDTWRLLEYIAENPRPELTVAVNTNLGVQDALIDKLIIAVNKIAPNVREVQVFTSNEATGKSANYIRTGLDYAAWIENVNYVADKCPSVLVSVMTTVGILSVPTFVEFISQLLAMRRRYNHRPFLQIQFSINMLRYPKFLELTNLDEPTKQRFRNQLQLLLNETNITQVEADQIRRLMDYVTSATSDTQSRRDFQLYVDELDRRRGTDFKETFPELILFYKLCQIS
jgi:organic radical activating enzyme